MNIHPILGHLVIVATITANFAYGLNNAEKNRPCAAPLLTAMLILIGWTMIIPA